MLLSLLRIMYYMRVDLSGEGKWILSAVLGAWEGENWAVLVA